MGLRDGAARESISKRKEKHTASHEATQKSYFGNCRRNLRIFPKAQLFRKSGWIRKSDRHPRHPRCSSAKSMEVDERSLKRREAAQASRDEKRQRMGDEAYKQMRADEEKERRRRQKKAAEEAAEQLEEAAAAEAVRKEQQEAEMAALRDKCAAASAACALRNGIEADEREYQYLVRGQ